MKFQSVLYYFSCYVKYYFRDADRLITVDQFWQGMREFRFSRSLNVKSTLYSISAMKMQQWERIVHLVRVQNILSDRSFLQNHELPRKFLFPGRMDDNERNAA